MHRRELRAMLARDDGHWWFRGRRRVVAAGLERLSLPMPASILDAGCGSGEALAVLRSYGDVRGMDVSADAIEAARRRGGYAELRVGSIERLPWPDDRFDLVACLDVVEHTADDRATLYELRRVTRIGGAALVTVPAYPRLWSYHDETSGHYRRYVRRTLGEVADDTGWSVERMTSFNLLLLAPAAALRTARKTAGWRGGRADLHVGPSCLDRLLAWPMQLEAAAIRLGATLPVGLSLMVTLKRR